MSTRPQKNDGRTDARGSLDRRRYPNIRPTWGKVGPRLQELVAASLRWTAGKQRPTATRLNAMLVTEGFEVGVTKVREAVDEWKRRRREAFVSLD